MKPVFYKVTNDLKLINCKPQTDIFGLKHEWNTMNVKVVWSGQFN